MLSWDEHEKSFITWGTGCVDAQTDLKHKHLLARLIFLTCGLVYPYCQDESISTFRGFRYSICYAKRNKKSVVGFHIRKNLLASDYGSSRLI